MDSTLLDKVLIVSASEAEHESLRRQLEGHPTKIVFSNSTQQALAVCQLERVDLVCVDMLCQEGAFELLKSLRTRYSSEQLPILLMLSKADACTIDRAFSMGANDYVVKPFALPVLLARIDAQLARKYRSLYCKSLALLHSCDADGKIVQVSDGWLEALGYRREEVLGRSPLEFMTPEAVHYARSVALPQFERQGKMRNVSYQFVRKDSHVIDVILSSHVEHNPCGELVRTHTVLFEVTQQKRAEAKLKKNEWRLQRAQRLAKLGFIDWDLRTNSMYWSDEFYRIYGLDPQTTAPSFEAALGAVHPDDLALVQDNLEAAKQGHKPYRLTHRIVRPDGQVRHVQAQAELVFDEAGNPVEMLGTIIDVTDSQQAHTALKLSEERFRKAFETSPDAVNINRLEDGLFVSVNEGFTAMTGYTKDDVNGKTSLELNIWHDPKDRRRMVACLQQEGQVKNFEALFRAKDSHVLTGLMSASKIMLEGQPHIISVTRDITQLKQAEEKDRLLAAIVEHSNDAIVGVSLDGTILSWNRAAQRLYGYTATEALGQPINILAVDGAPEELQRVVEKVKQGRPIKHHETLQKSKTGKTLEVSITASPVMNGSGHLHSVSIISHDNSHRIKSRQREQRLRQALQEVAIEMAQTLSKTIDEKDLYTAGHCQRLADYSVALARRLKLSPRRIEQLRHAALLHDVGKVGVPEKILSKPSALSAQEWVWMKKHVTIGAELVRSVHTLEHAAQIVLQHHECWDGSGYPAGLKGEDILLEARILSVVDAYDAMITDRPYRRALSVEAALEELRLWAGKQWDPLVVEAFTEMITEPVAK